MNTNPISIGAHKIGRNTFTLIAGPCAIESEKQMETIVSFLKTEEIHVLRGGIYKLRTSPSNFQGLREEAFELIKKIKSSYSIPFITEVTDPRQIDHLDSFVDIYQVGTRNMFNYDLLKELGKTRKPILLKRNFAAQIKEWLYATEYILKGGNENIILCERGIRTFDREFRNNLDINSIIYIKKETSFPILVDPSHAMGHSKYIIDASKAALAAGADGLLVEVHNDPKNALCDGQQALSFDQYSKLVTEVKKLLPLFNKSLNS